MFPFPQCFTSLGLSDPVEFTKLSCTDSATLEGKPGEVLTAGCCKYQETGPYGEILHNHR